ncbi:hypothetical protein [Commensalibacter communis]|nr:hypothetical protein [Commensalibacter communis]
MINDNLPKQVQGNGKIKLLDGAINQDIIEYAKAQLTAPSLEIDLKQ